MWHSVHALHMPLYCPQPGLLMKKQLNMAIAMRMATLMQLHREETYAIPNSTKELVRRAESARRTLVRLPPRPSTPVAFLSHQQD